MKFCEYQAGRFVNPQFIVRVLISCNERARISNVFNAEEWRQQMDVYLEIQGDAAPVRVERAYVEQVARLVPTVEERMSALQQAMFKAQVIASLQRFPLAA